MTEPQRALMRRLAAAFGDESTGRMLVQAALREARRANLPNEPDALLDFVRAYMMSTLTEELGPRLVAALLEDLEQELAIIDRPSTRVAIGSMEPPSTRRVALSGSMEPPKSSGVRLRPNVVLCDTDRFARAALARSLVGTDCDVAAAESPTDIMSIDGRIDVAIVNMQMGEVASMLGALSARAPEARVVAVSNDAHAAESLLRAVGVRSHRVVPQGMRSLEMREMIKRLAIG